MLCVVGVVAVVIIASTQAEYFRFRMPEEVSVNTVIAELPRLLNVPPMEEFINADSKFKLLSSNPVYHRLFAVDQRSGILRTNGPIDRDQLCQRAELCCNMVEQHEVTNINDIKVVGMEAVQNKMRKDRIFTGLICKLDFRVAFSSKTAKFPTSFASIQIELMDLNDNVPKFTELSSSQVSRNYDGSLVYVVSIPESAHTGYQLPLPLAQDGDAGAFGVVGYRLEEPSTQARSQADHRFSPGFPFVLIPTRRDDGVILPKLELREPLDFETRQNYYATLIAHDEDRFTPNSAEILIQIDVLDENDNQPVVSVRTPLHNSLDTSSVGSGPLQISVREDCAVGTLLAHFEARDADSGDNGRVTFAWGETTPPQVQRLFELHPNSGELRLADRLDYDSLVKSSLHRGVDAYNLVVVASDDGRPNRLSTTASIAIEVVDVNDEEPMITVMDLANRSPTQLEVLENEDKDTFVALVTVQDLDGASGPNGQFVCTLNNTQFRLVAADAFMSHKMSLPGGLIGFDEVPGGLHSVTGAGRAEFQLVTANSFDREQAALHYVAIRCRDNGSPPLESQTTFTVTVLDVNDNPPYFPTNPLTVTISEDVQVGSLVTTLNASDPDRPHDLQPIIYSLLSITALPNLHPMTPVNSTQFRLEGHTGRLLLTEPLDRETNLEYQLTVRATDRGSPEAQSCDLALRIQVLDVNDNPPVFGNPSGYRFVIEEEKEPGSVVGVVTATDADEGENGRVSYRLFGTSAAVQRGFVVNPNTGEITTKVVLDREVNAAYEFYVTAEDSSPSKRLTATTKVVVELLDINDNVPKFIYPTQPNHTIHASAYSKVGTAIVKLTVFDADAAGEQGLLFILKNATSPGLFTLNPSSGELSFAREILDEDIGSHYLEIEAKDNGVPPRSSVTSITVVIDTRAHQRAPGATNSGLDYSNRPAYSKAWGSRAEPAYPLYGQEGSGHEVYSRQDGSPPAFDRRLILICCLAFLGCLLLVVFGAILIRFKHRNPLHDNEASTNSVNFVHAKEAKYRAATLQPQTTPVSAFGASGVKDAGRYVYGWSAQRSPLIASTTAAPQHRLLPDQQHQQEQFFRMGFVNNPAAAVTMSSAGNANFERSTRGDSMLQAKNRSSSLGDSLEDYERPPLPMNDRANLYLSQGQVNRAGTVWEPRADRGLNNYEAAGDGSGYYNKLSATSGVILQPGAYMQGGEFFHENCDESNGEPDASVFLRSARPTSTRNAGYQTLSNVSPQSSSDETANFFADAPPGALERADDATRTAPPPPPPQPTTATSASSSLSSWRKNLGKKGIVSSSFV